MRAPVREGKIAAPSAKLARLGEPEDIAYAAHFLVSDESRWIAGQMLVIDGGAEVYAGQPYDVHWHFREGALATTGCAHSAKRAQLR